MPPHTPDIVVKNMEDLITAEMDEVRKMIMPPRLESCFQNSLVDENDDYKQELELGCDWFTR